MGKTYEVKISDIDEIKRKSEMMTGLLAVIMLFVELEAEDKRLRSAIKCLEEVARSMLGKCNSLLNEFRSSL